VDTLANNQTSLKSSLGGFTDLFSPTKVHKAYPEQVNKTDETRVVLSSTLDSLFIQASAAPQKFRINVGPSRDSIIARGKSAVGFLAGALNTPSARERHALRVLFKGLSKSHRPQVSKLVSDSLLSGNRRTKLMSAEICGRNEIRECIPSLKKMMREKGPHFRAAGALNLGRMQNEKLNADFSEYLKDDHPYVVMRAAWGLGHNLISADSPALKKIMNHHRQLVRNGFIQGVLNRDTKISLKWIRAGLKSVKTARGQKTLIQLIPYADESKKEAKRFRRIYRQLEGDIKAHLERCIAGSSSFYWKKQFARVSE